MSSEHEAPIESIDQLVDYFRSGEKPVERFRIGTEHEKIGLYADSLERLDYTGPRGIGALLNRIADLDGWERVYEGENVVALLKDGASITLEPGGQLELSGAPLPSIRETCREFTRHVDLMKRASEDLGVIWLALGADPLHPVSKIPRMPKGRYDIMRAYLPTRGGHALDMMHATATVQANYDYSGEQDMAAKLRTALGCSAIVSAMFANSPIELGRESGFVTRRVEIWRDMDPDRCGLLPFALEREFGYLDYAEWALDVPMFFVVRDHHYFPAGGMTFRRFWEQGFEGQRATLGDWDTHLTTLFPEARLKRIIEVRGADTVPPDMICALPALWKGLLYDAQACEAAWRLVEGFTLRQHEALLTEAARHGLAASAPGRPVLEIARELLAISSEGLRQIAVRGEAEDDERSFLDPIQQHLDRGKSPGEILLDNFRGEWGGDIGKLIEHARY